MGFSARGFRPRASRPWRSREPCHAPAAELSLPTDARKQFIPLHTEIPARRSHARDVHKPPGHTRRTAGALSPHFSSRRIQCGPARIGCAHLIQYANKKGALRASRALIRPHSTRALMSEVISTRCASIGVNPNRLLCLARTQIQICVRIRGDHRIRLSFSVK